VIPALLSCVVSMSKDGQLAMATDRRSVVCGNVTVLVTAGDSDSS
jgi:hypothetical protein